MASEEERRVSRQHIQLVQNLIERCLQLYMDRKEVIETLLAQAKIEPGFTELVWKKLEEENQEFFKAYNMRLMVKNQIILFNKLLEKQVDFMRQISPSGILPVSRPNGSQTSSLQQTPSCYNADHTLALVSPNNVHHPSDPSRLHNGGSVNQRSTHVSNNTGHSERVDFSLNMPVSQNSHLRVKQEPNGVGDTLEHDYSYSNHSAFTFGIDGNILDRRPLNGNSSVAPFGNAELRPNLSVAPFGNVDSNSDALSEKLQDGDASSFGFLGQIPRNFSLSDLTADFSHSFDILESYPRSPFVPPDNSSLLDLGGRDCEGENKVLDGISEDFNYDDFSSD